MIALKEEDTSKNRSSLSSIQRPIKRDAIQNVHETELENLNPTQGELVLKQIFAISEDVNNILLFYTLG